MKEEEAGFGKEAKVGSKREKERHGGNYSSSVLLLSAVTHMKKTKTKHKNTKRKKKKPEDLKRRRGAA